MTYFDSLASFVRAVQRERALSTYDQRWWWCALLIVLFGLLLGLFSNRHDDQLEPEEQGTTVALVSHSPYRVRQDYYQCWFERRHCLSMLTQNQRFCQENINDWQHQNQLLKEAFRRKYQQLERDYQALRRNNQQLSQTTRTRLAQLNERTP